MNKAATIWSGALIAAIATIAACDIAFGLTFQLQPLLLERQGVPAWLIGAIVAMGPLGILIAGPFLPGLVDRFSAKTVALVAIASIFVILALFKLAPPLWWWFPLRFLFGVAAGSLFTVSETWVVSMSDESSRGRVMGLYSSVLALTFGVGPLMLPFTGIDGWAPWLIGMFFVALGIVPLLRVKIGSITHGDEKGSIANVVARQPLIFACAVAATLFDSLLISFFSIFAMRNGVPVEEASLVLGVAIIGGALLYYPMGVLADRWSRDALTFGCSVVTLLCAFLILPLIKSPLLYPLTLIFVTAGFGVYVLALAAIGTAFKGKDVVAASAAIAATWGLGGIAGPPVVGRLIDHFGINVLPLSIAGIFAILTLCLALNRMRMLKALPA